MQFFAYIRMHNVFNLFWLRQNFFAILASSCNSLQIFWMHNTFNLFDQDKKNFKLKLFFFSIKVNLWKTSKDLGKSPNKLSFTNNALIETIITELAFQLRVLIFFQVIPCYYVSWLLILFIFNWIFRAAMVKNSSKLKIIIIIATTALYRLWALSSKYWLPKENSATII